MSLDRDPDAIFVVQNDEQFLQHFIAMATSFYDMPLCDLLKPADFQHALDSCGQRNELGQLCLSFNLMQDALKKVLHIFTEAMLAQMAANNEIECGYDTDANDFIFWRKEEDPNLK